jgi:hypothetical protein
MAYVLPEDDPLVAIALTMDRDLARGGSGEFLCTPSANYLALEPLPRRVLVASERMVELGLAPLDEALIHPLVRLARAFEGEVRNHSFGGPPRASYDDHRSETTLKAVVPSLLAIESALSKVDRVEAQPDGIVEQIATEILREGRVYPYPARHNTIVSALVRRVLALEARLDKINTQAKKKP